MNDQALEEPLAPPDPLSVRHIVVSGEWFVYDSLEEKAVSKSYDTELAAEAALRTLQSRRRNRDGHYYR